MFHANYDVIVVGAGISGLYTAREILKQNPKFSVAIAERYKGLGGRTYSYWPPEFPGVHWEMGAGRIRSDHKLLMGLIKDYGLTWVPIGDRVSFLGGPEHNGRGGSHLEPNTFESMMIPVYLEPLLQLDPSILANTTLEKLMIQVYGAKKTAEVLTHFPYRGEVDTLRADIALEGFVGKGEMSSHKGYGILKEGFSELIARLQDDCEARGLIVLNRHTLVDIDAVGGSKATDLTFDFGGAKQPSGKITLRAEKGCVLALHRDALGELDVFKGWQTLRHLKTQPLLRCYAIFDPKSVWFKDLSRVVTPARPRYVLPMDVNSGTIMISYTDGSDARAYMACQKEDGDKGLEKMIMADIRKLFPDRTIPKPLFFRSHPWTTGCTYWLPGPYDPATESRESIHPLPSTFPGVWLCGESWAMRQAWVEGALEQADVLLESINFD